MSTELQSDADSIELMLSAEELALVKAILDRYAFGRRAIVFGSRVVTSEADRKRVKPYSDLDITLGEPPLTLTQMDSLRDAFSQSDLRMRVDVVGVSDLPRDWKMRAWPL